MFLNLADLPQPSVRLPHAGGGVSTHQVRPSGHSKSSPRRWGCFFMTQAQGLPVLVFPTQVGVFLCAGRLAPLSNRLPHAGGGVSDQFTREQAREASSPRRWGCFRSRHHHANRLQVFPTQVGVFPHAHWPLFSQYRLPHAGGGVSFDMFGFDGVSLSSPRRWGCFSTL